ncbi:hypothetical protein [Nocardia africana]|uniref:Uncharacterized protein n=1 Tax=Nocardia africana TaxID=134964 RepID=A0ABW6NTV4_9NOCA
MRDNPTDRNAILQASPSDRPFDDTELSRMHLWGVARRNHPTK